MVVRKIVPLPQPRARLIDEFFKQDKHYKTGVINDPLGQTHSHASSEHCFLFCFARFEKWGRTDRQHVRKKLSLPAVTVDWPSGSINSAIIFMNEMLSLRGTWLNHTIVMKPFQ